MEKEEIFITYDTELESDINEIMCATNTVSAIKHDAWLKYLSIISERSILTTRFFGLFLTAEGQSDYA